MTTKAPKTEEDIRFIKAVDYIRQIDSEESDRSLSTDTFNKHPTYIYKIRKGLQSADYESFDYLAKYGINIEWVKKGIGEMLKKPVRKEFSDSKEKDSELEAEVQKLEKELLNLLRENRDLKRELEELKARMNK